MVKCEVIDLTPSDCDSDGGFKESHLFVSISSFGILHQVSVTSSFYHNENCFTGFVHVRR